MDRRPDAPADRPLLMEEDWPPVTGAPGVAQGGYGEVGNLEVVAPAVDDGLWVGWWNADVMEPDESARAGAALGCWSGALRFGRGHRYVAATITQVSHGPDWLECLALTEARALRRLVWSPADGFVDHGPVAEGVTSYSPLRELPDRSLHVACLYDTGLAEVRSARPPHAYPATSFIGTPIEPPVRPTALDAATHDDHLDLLATDHSGDVRHSCPARTPQWAGIATGCTDARLGVGPLGAVAAVHDRLGWRVVPIDPGGADVALGSGAQCSLSAADLADGPTWQVLLREGGTLTHHTIAADGSARAKPLRARVWAPPGTPTVHRDPHHAG